MTFDDDETLCHYVDQQVRGVLPAEWLCIYRIQARAATMPRESLRLDDMEWKIARAQRTGVLEHDYLLRVSADRRWFFIVHGNSDAGARPPGFLKARILHASTLDWYSVGTFVADTLATNDPNTWGFS